MAAINMREQMREENAKKRVQNMLDTDDQSSEQDDIPFHAEERNKQRLKAFSAHQMKRQMFEITKQMQTPVLDNNFMNNTNLLQKASYSALQKQVSIKPLDIMLSKKESVLKKQSTKRRMTRFEIAEQELKKIQSIAMNHQNIDDLNYTSIKTKKCQKK